MPCRALWPAGAVKIMARHAAQIMSSRGRGVVNQRLPLFCEKRLKEARFGRTSGYHGWSRPVAHFHDFRILVICAQGSSLSPIPKQIHHLHPQSIGDLEQAPDRRIQNHRQCLVEDLNWNSGTLGSPEVFTRFDLPNGQSRRFYRYHGPAPCLIDVAACTTGLRRAITAAGRSESLVSPTLPPPGPFQQLLRQQYPRFLRRPHASMVFCVVQRLVDLVERS